MSSWKTTVGGILTALSGVFLIVQGLIDSDPATPNFSVAVGMISGGVALAFARDNNVSSEKAGATK